MTAARGSKELRAALQREEFGSEGKLDEREDSRLRRTEEFGSEGKLAGCLTRKSGEIDTVDTVSRLKQLAFFCDVKFLPRASQNTNPMLAVTDA